MWGVSAWLSGAGGQGFAFYPLLFALRHGIDFASRRRSV